MKTIFGLLALAGLLTACEQPGDVQPTVPATAATSGTPTAQQKTSALKDTISQAVAPFVVSILTSGELPASVKQYVATKYPGWTIGKAAALISGEFKSFYVTVISVDPADFKKYGYGAAELYFDEQGSLLPYGPHSTIGKAATDVTLLLSDVPNPLRTEWKNYQWTYQRGAANSSGVKLVVVKAMSGTAYQLIFDKEWTLLSFQKI